MCRDRSQLDLPGSRARFSNCRFSEDKTTTNAPATGEANSGVSGELSRNPTSPSLGVAEEDEGGPVARVGVGLVIPGGVLRPGHRTHLLPRRALATHHALGDVRLVAATHRDLAKMVAEGRFREDLFYRLNVFPLVLPPLRERRDDIPRLVRHFTQQFARRMGRRIETIPSAVMDTLVCYPWPGNVREW